MVERRLLSRFTLGLLGIVALNWVACGSSLKTQTPPVLTPTNTARVLPIEQGLVNPPSPAPLPDPVLVLIAESERRFEAGLEELALGHGEAAKRSFDQALSVLMESPYGGRTEPRIRDHFDRLVDRISTYEVKALNQGDGFTEQKYAPATIDELLALSTMFEAVPAAAELRSTVQSDLATGGNDINIPLNQQVLSYVALFQGRLHDFIEVGMKRGSKYLPMIQNVFRAEGLPLDLAYVPLIESAFNPNALSKAQAKGVWQFMAGTAVENGLRRDWYIDERSDPMKATVAAARYLKTLVNLFSGDWHLALASYNGGPGRVQKALKRVGVEDFWTLAENPKVLPRETREYVPMILAAIVIARNPAQYGFDVEYEAPAGYDAITLPRPVDLRRVAEWAGTTIDEIQALNPELRRWTTPLKDTQYELKVPAGTADRVNARLNDTPAVELVSLKWYTVKKGDTLAAIARRLQVAQSDLAEANDLKVTARVATGQKLIVPRETTTLMASRTDRPVPVADSRPISTQSPLVAQSSTNSNRVKVSYTVREGDTLSSIAKVFRTTVASLRTWNKIDGSFIAAGDRLTIYAARSVQAD
jgi:membrane-bound lytic murein transglycosylase D